MTRVDLITDRHWLDKWSSYIAGKNVLELGCGSGEDTGVIAALAQAAVAGDIQPGEKLPPAVQVLTLDHSKPLPFKTEFDVVVASLSLHYFDWQTTEKIVAEVARVLVPGGILVCRVNSDKDRHYGAQGYPEIEPQLFNVEGQQKRFFDRLSIGTLFSDRWALIGLKHVSIDRYSKPKTVWEFGAVKT